MGVIAVADTALDTNTRQRAMGNRAFMLLVPFNADWSITAQVLSKNHANQFRLNSISK